MAHALIDELKTENLCTHFILPFLKLNKFSSIASNFVNSYLTPDGSQIIVHVVDTQLLSRKCLIHPEYRGQRLGEGGEIWGIYLIYQIPLKWRKDVELFRQGNFSAMSKAAKDSIIRFSGLPHLQKEKGTKRIVTDGRLLALEKHTMLKEMWENELSSDDKRPTGRVVLNEEDELLSIPGKESYLDPSKLYPLNKG